MKKLNIHGIIFDLGKVIVQVDLDRSFDALKKINPEFCFPEDFYENKNLKLYESGKMSDEAFFLYLKDFFKLDCDLNTIAKAWNAMIVSVPVQGIHLLQRLKQHYALYALSNTNACHISAINQYLSLHHEIPHIEKLFDKIYLSHLVGLIKPDAAIFEYVIKDLDVMANQLVFIDDNAENIKTAKKLGFHSIHLLEQNRLEDELTKLLKEISMA